MTTVEVKKAMHSVVITVAAASGIALLAVSGPAASADAAGEAIRPYRVAIPEKDLVELRRKVEATPGAGRAGERDPSVARRATRDDAETRQLLDDRVRLAQGGSETECPAAVHDRD